MAQQLAASMRTRAAALVKATARTVDSIRPPAPGITILIYHRVGAPDTSQMNLDPATFDDQLAWLADHTRIVSLDDACTELAAGTDVDPATVVTFDDGTDDWVRHVLPVLDRRSIPATFYVSSGFIDGETPLPSDGTPASWDQLAELSSSPLVTLGSHTRHHRLLRNASRTETIDEVEYCDTRIAEETGVTVQHFAYPKAVAGSAAAEAVIAERYRSAVVAGTTANRAGADLHRLARSPIQRSDTHVDVVAKARGGMGAEDAARQLANRVRYRGRID